MPEVIVSHASNLKFGTKKNKKKRVSPVDGKLIYEYSDDTKAVDEAVHFLASHRKKIKKIPLAKRIQIVENFAKNVTKNLDKLAEAISIDTGKPLWEAKTEANGLKAKAIISIEQINAYKNEIVENAVPGASGEVSKKPLGITAILGPFNFPMHLPNGQVIPSFLEGNSIIFKPSELTTRSGSIYADLWWKSGMPKEAFAFVTGGKDVGEKLVIHKDIKGVFFTGSVPVGIAIRQATASMPDKLVALEMGGVNPLVIWKDANLDAAAIAALTGICLTTGQRCTATRRLIVHTSVAQKFLKKLDALIQNVKIGLPTEDIFCGPLISDTAKEKYHTSLANQKAKGAKIIIQGNLKKDLPQKGAFVTPVIIEGGDFHRFSCEETFSPICTFEPIKNMNEVVERCAWSNFGLSASIFSANEKTFQEFRENVESGLINWNQPTNGSSSKLPFGGIGLSGNFRPAGSAMLQHCTYPLASLLNRDPKNLIETNWTGLNKNE